jgi:hypothetical protein
MLLPVLVDEVVVGDAVPDPDDEPEPELDEPEPAEPALFPDPLDELDADPEPFEEPEFCPGLLGLGELVADELGTEDALGLLEAVGCARVWFSALAKAAGASSPNLYEAAMMPSEARPTMVLVVLLTRHTPQSEFAHPECPHDASSS